MLFQIIPIALLLGFCLAFSANPVIQNLAPDTWYEVPNSHMAGVGVECGSECPECPDHWPAGSDCSINNIGVRGVIDLWSGGTFDTKRNRLVIWGGGHSGYGGNELYGFDLDDLAWTRIVDPSYEAVACVTIYPDSTPVSRHTYGLPVYLPDLDVFFACPMVGRYCGGSGSDPHTWFFDFAGGKWINKNPAGAAVNGQHGGAVYDPVTNKVYGWSTAGTGSGGFFAYDVSSNRWDILNTKQSDFWGAPNGALDTRRNRIVIVGSNTGEVKVVDLSDPAWEIQSFATTGGGSDVLNGAPGVVYDPVADRYVAWDGGPVWVLHPENWTWEQKASCPQARNGNGTYGRFNYSPSENAYVLVNNMSENVLIYKLTSGASVHSAPAAASVQIRLDVHPNPFKTGTTISLDNVRAKKIDLSIYALSGRKIADMKNIKTNRVQWDGSRCSNGLYIVVVKTGSRTFSRQICIMK